MLAVWEPALDAMKEHVGLPSTRAVAERIHTLFPAVCEEIGARVRTEESAAGARLRRRR
jgi:hypothetical protein